MKNKLSLCIAALALLCGCATAPVTHGIPNLALVEPGVYRGGQPDAEGWAWLKAQGVAYDVKLNTWAEASDALASTNNIIVWDAGMINFAQQTVGSPDAHALIDTVQVIANHAGKAGVYVHCEHGQDRTGLVIGMYRVRAEGWTKANAYREMIAHGFHPLLLGLGRAWDDDVP